LQFYIEKAYTNHPQTWKDLTAAERQATVMENSLTSLEKKLDILLQQAEETESKIQAGNTKDVEEAQSSGTSTKSESVKEEKKDG
jgi:23S rRNA maturation mini-RNase III